MKGKKRRQKDAEKSSSLAAVRQYQPAWLGRYHSARDLIAFKWPPGRVCGLSLLPFKVT